MADPNGQSYCETCGVTVNSLRSKKCKLCTAIYKYAEKHGITKKIASDAGVSLHQYVVDYARSHGPKLRI